MTWTENEHYVIDEAGCWVWAGYCDRNGYARTYDRTAPQGSRVQWAHRVSYRIHKGEIPPRYEVDHVCQNTRCVNPEHLDAVTRAEHVARTMRRLGKDDLHQRAAHLRRMGLTYGEIADAVGLSGRAAAQNAVRRAVEKGLVDPDDVPAVARLTDDDRSDIQALYALGIPQTEIAAFYGIDSSHVSRITRGVSSHGRVA